MLHTTTEVTTPKVAVQSTLLYWHSCAGRILKDLIHIQGCFGFISHSVSSGAVLT